MTVTRRLLGVIAVLSAIVVVFAASMVVVVLVQDDDQNAANPLTELVANTLDVESESEISERQSGAVLTDEQRAYVDDLVEEGAITEEQAEELREWWSLAPEWIGTIEGSDEWEDLEYTFRFAPFEGFRKESESAERFEWSEDFDFEGMLPEDFADRLDEWFAEREYVVPFGDEDDSEGKRRFRFGRGSFREFPDDFGWSSEDSGSDWLEELVEKGLIGPDDADQIEGWFDELPESFDFDMEGFPGDGSFEFDSDDGKFRFRGHWRTDEGEWESDEDGGSKDDGDKGDDHLTG